MAGRGAFDDEPQHSGASCSLSWHLDYAWHAARREADARRATLSNATSIIAPGCCPAVVEFYGTKDKTNSSAAVANRCCTNRLDAHKLPPLRPFGGVSYREFIRSALAQHEQPSILMIGDSLGEQLMLAMLCKAWSEGYKVSFADISYPSNAMGFATAVATIRNTRHHETHNSSAGALAALEVRFARFQNPPTPDEIRSAVAGGNESHVLLQSWFERSVTHGWSASRILSHAQQMIASIVRLRPSAHLVAMDARAQHFPGGKWRSDARYPPANSSSEPSAACDDAVPEDTWYETELDWYNTKLSALNALHGVVRIGPLQRYAGMFHVGYGLDRQPFLGGRDCLHWCLVPSMIDLWASAAFGAFTAPCRTSSATLPLEAYPRTHFW